MGFLDGTKKKAKELAETHGDKIEEGIDKAAGLVDNKTGGAHRDKIATGSEKAKGLVGQVAQAGQVGQAAQAGQADKPSPGA